jgi:dTDP-4-dehydrorhamnose 3,5-epimerase-like enzyme
MDASSPEQDRPRLQPVDGIPGAFVARFPVVRYAGGTLVEARRTGWDGLFDEPLDHLYWIATTRGVERDWGRHTRTADRYAAVAGTIEVALLDGRAAAARRAHLVVLDAARGDGLLIPSGVWHTFRVTSETGILLNSKSPAYDPVDPDKERRTFGEPGFAAPWPGEA